MKKSEYKLFVQGLGHQRKGEIMVLYLKGYRIDKRFPFLGLGRYKHVWFFGFINLLTFLIFNFYFFGCGRASGE